MADGDQVDHIAKRGTVQTTDVTLTPLVTISIPVGTEGIVAIHGWAEGVKTDAAKSYRLNVVGIGTINGGSFALTEQADFGEVVGGGATYGVSLSENGDDIRLAVAGANSETVRWQGRLEVEITEQAMSGGG